MLPLTLQHWRASFFTKHRLLYMSPVEQPSSNSVESNQPHPDQIREALLELSDNPELAATLAAARITEASGDLNAQRASLQSLVLQGAESLLNTAGRSPAQVQEQFASIANLTITGDAPPYTVTFEGWRAEGQSETAIISNFPTRVSTLNLQLDNFRLDFAAQGSGYRLRILPKPGQTTFTIPHDATLNVIASLPGSREDVDDPSTTVFNSITFDNVTASNLTEIDRLMQAYITETLLTDNAPEAQRRGHDYLMSNVTPGPTILRNQIEAGEVYHAYSLNRNLGQPSHFGNVQVQYRFFNNQWQHHIVSSHSPPLLPQSAMWSPVGEDIFPVPPAGSNQVEMWPAYGNTRLPSATLTLTEAATRRSIKSISDQLAQYNT